MKMNRRHGMALLLMALMTLPIVAQQQFTLEDLNFGGTNYQKMIPQNRPLKWWGDQLVRYSRGPTPAGPLTHHNGKEKLLFTRAQLERKVAGLTDESQSIRHG